MEWIEKTIYKLKFMKISDRSKLEIFKENLSWIIAVWAITIDSEQPDLDYTSFIEALRNKFRTSALASNKLSELRKLRFDSSQNAIEFIEKIRSILRVTEPGFTNQRICQIICEKISGKLNRTISNLGCMNNSEGITNVLINDHDKYMEMKMQEENQINMKRSYYRNKNFFKRYGEPNRNNYRQQKDEEKSTRYNRNEEISCYRM